MTTQSNYPSENNLKISTNQSIRSGFWVRFKAIPADKLAWLWLLLGILLMPFTFFQTVIPLAAWLAPVLLLRFERTSRRAWLALPLIFFAYASGVFFASRGLPFNLLGFIGNILFKGLVWTLPYVADRLLSHRLQGSTRTLVFPMAFTTVDWLLAVLRVSSTGSPAYSQYTNPALMQLLSITGMWGITFLIMVFASIVNAQWEYQFDLKKMRTQVSIFAGVLLAVLLYGILRMNFAVPSLQTVQVATITIDPALTQAATSDIGWLTFNRSTDAQRAAIRPKFNATVNQMLARSETALKGGAKIVSWQESAGWVLAEDKASVLDRAAALAKQYDAYLQISLEVTTRTQNLQYLLNQSILIDPTGQTRWTYEKTHPVPYDEAFVTIAGPGVLPIVDTPYGRLSTAICYDTYFPTLLRQAGQGNVDIFLAPTNDVRPYASSAAVMATFRAIENGFSLVRPTGNGTSLVTDYQGRTLASQDYNTNNSGILLTTVPTHGVTTLYSRIGDLFAYLCAFGLIILTILAFLRQGHPVRITQPQTL